MTWDEIRKGQMVTAVDSVGEEVYGEVAYIDDDTMIVNPHDENNVRLCSPQKMLIKQTAVIKEVDGFAVQQV